MLTTASDERLVVFPLRSPATFALYKKALASFWTPEEVDLAHDMRDWETKLTEPERRFIENVLAFFAASDGVVNENLAANFLQEVQLSEARLFYAMQIAIEAIHGETYSLLIDTYVRDEARKSKLLNCVRFRPVAADRLGAAPASPPRGDDAAPEDTDSLSWIQHKADFAAEYFSRERSLAERLVAFACVEGIFFSSSFCAIYWLKKRGLMPGLTFSNELISRDEGLHTEFAAHLYRDVMSEAERGWAPPATVREIVARAAEVELAFVRGSLPVAVIGMNADLMSNYVRFVSNRLLALLIPGSEPLFTERCENPFDFMTMISVQQKTNFFESRNSSYSRAGVRVRTEAAAGAPGAAAAADPQAAGATAASAEAAAGPTALFSADEDF